MFMKIITIVLCLSIAYGDVKQPTTTEATISSRIDHHRAHAHHKHQKHHKKRGILSGIPPYKAGYDIPVVHHSFVKPFVVDYPIQRVPIGVKIPLKNPFAFKFPQAIGHHHLHAQFAAHGLKYPVVERPFILPSQHLYHEALKPIHHVHHHVVPTVDKPVFTLQPAPVQLPTLLPAPTTQIHFRPIKPAIVQPAHLLPAPAPIPITPQVQNIPFIPQAPLVPQVPLVQQVAVTPQVPYIIRPGHSVQTSYFATYPKHQIANFAAQAAFPFLHAQPQVGFHNHLLFQRPIAQAPHIDLLPPHHHAPQALTPQYNVQQHQVPQTVFNVPDSNAQLPDFQVPHHHGVLIPQTPQQDTSGWTAITTPTVATTAQTQPTYDYPSPNNANQYDGNHIPVYEQQEEQNYHNQFEQHHYDQQNQFEQEHQFQQQEQYEQHQQGNQFEQDQAQFDAQQYHQEQQQQLHHQQQQQQLHHEQQLAQEYGVPPQQRLDSNEYGEGRTSERNTNNFSDSQESPPKNKFHNHIPLGLQLPLNTPSDFN